MGGAAAGASAGGKEIVTEGISPLILQRGLSDDAMRATLTPRRQGPNDEMHEEAQEIGPQAVKLTSLCSTTQQMLWSVCWIRRLFRQGQHALPPRHAKNAA